MIKEAIKVLFPTTRNIDEIVEIIDKYKNKFGLNTELRLKHFLAQVREEVGPEFKVKRENLNYSEEAVLKMWPKRFTKEQADKYARDEDTPIASQEAIANLAYANRLGNGNADSDGDGDMDAYDDGYKYRGAGCLQITGKGNFEEVIKRIKKYAPNGSTNPDTLEGFILFGMAFWMWNDCYRAADTDDVDKVTAIINKHTHSYESRKEHYRKIKYLA